MGLKGTNVFKFNEATMIAALQMYLDSLFATGAAPKVTGVEKLSDTFVITTDGETEIRG